MRTDELVRVLANGIEPAARHAVARRHAIAIAAGTAGALVVMLAWLGIRPDLADAVKLPMFWIKLAFPLSMGALAVVVGARLGRPGAKARNAGLALVAPIAAMWLLAAATLLAAPAGSRLAAVLGTTWRACPTNIAVVSLPLLAALVWAMKGLAPTRPALAGAAAGLTAGAFGAAVYALHCIEMAPAFLAVWYVLGMLIPAAAGALIGQRVLRW